MADVREGSLVMDGGENSLFASTQTAVDLAELEMDVTSQDANQGEVGGFCSDHSSPQKVRATTFYKVFEANVIHVALALV